MKKLALFAVCFSAAVTLAAAADKSYYFTKPDAATLPADGRILMYDPADGGSDKNITGAVLKQQVNTTPVLRSYSAADRAYVYFVGSKLVVTTVKP